MPLSSTELARARDLVADILEELQLDAYLFEVEPGTGEWEVRVECPVAEGWAHRRLRVDRERLLAADEDPAQRRRLVDDWQQRLVECLRVR